MMINPIDALPLSDAEKRLIDKTPDADRHARQHVLLASLNALPDAALLDPTHPSALTRANNLPDGPTLNR